MKFQKQLERMIKEHPSLFPTRLHAMNHLFCVIGNGYDWKNGALVEPRYIRQETIDDERSERRAEHRKLMKAAIEADPTSKWSKEMTERFEREDYTKANYKLIAATKVDSFTPKNSSLPSGMRDQFYPLSEYSAIRNVPADVKPDWQEAINEMTQILEKHGIKV